MNYTTKDLPNSEVSFGYTVSVVRATMMEGTIIRELINNKMKCNLFVLVENLNIQL